MDNEQMTAGLMIAGLKALRVAVDGNIQQTQHCAESINRGPGGREVALAITKLQEAKMWLGQALGAIGHKLPEGYRDEVNETKEYRDV